MAIILFIDWEVIFDKYGWPTTVLLVLLAVSAAVIRKAIWPRVTQYLDDARQATLDAKQQLVDRAKRLEELQDGMMQDFKDTLDKAGQRADKQIELLGELLDIARRPPPGR